MNQIRLQVLQRLRQNFTGAQTGDGINLRLVDKRQWNVFTFHHRSLRIWIVARKLNFLFLRKVKEAYAIATIQQRICNLSAVGYIAARGRFFANPSNMRSILKSRAK
jgi:hypothetical protein